MTESTLSAVSTHFVSEIRTRSKNGASPRAMKSLTVSLVMLVIAATSLAGRAEGGILGTFTHVQDASGTASDNNVCILTTPLASSYNIFGTTVSPGQVFCLKQTVGGVEGLLHCESLTPGLFSMDVVPASAEAGTHFCIDPPECSHYANVNAASNPSGSLQDLILSNLPAGTSVTYSFDGTEGPTTFDAGASPIPGCPTLGPGYAHVEGVSAMNGFLVVPTPAGSNVTTSSLRGRAWHAVVLVRHDPAHRLPGCGQQPTQHPPQSQHPVQGQVGLEVGERCGDDAGRVR